MPGRDEPLLGEVQAAISRMQQQGKLAEHCSLPENVLGLGEYGGKAAACHFATRCVIPGLTAAQPRRRAVLYCAT